MLDVFLTFDVEIWCDGWSDIDRKFGDCFERYVYGTTSRGDYGLPFTLSVLDEYGLPGVFFVEPLFSTRFGAAPLAEIVGLIRERKQEVQLHLHPEWVDEAREPLLAKRVGKRRLLRQFTRSEQSVLIAAGKRLLRDAGADDSAAFRAGSFGFNEDTLLALKSNGIRVDASYNACMYGPDSGVLPDALATDAFQWKGVSEYPMTVFKTGLGRLRHAQLTACSRREMEGLLWCALDAGRKCFVILSHNFELLAPSKRAPDNVVIERYTGLCSFLDKHRDCFRVRGMRGSASRGCSIQPAPLVSPLWRTAGRMIEQAYRRRYR